MQSERRKYVSVIVYFYYRVVKRVSVDSEVSQIWTADDTCNVGSPENVKTLLIQTSIEQMANYKLECEWDFQKQM